MVANHYSSDSPNAYFERWLPTIEEIAFECEIIRSGWSEEEEIFRRSGSNEAATCVLSLSLSNTAWCEF